MLVKVRNVCTDFNSYRAARVKSLFNAESGANFDLDAELPIEGQDWKLGVIVGPSGSGKTSMGRQVGELYDPEWPADRPIVDVIAESGDFDAVTAALSAVGLGDVPAWLRPYSVLSNGEKFRAMLARLVSEEPERAVVDEFTSVVDRQIAKIGALAFQKAWRRTKGKQVVLLSCHYDILDWLQPDWVYDTAKREFAGRWLQPRPPIELEIWQTDWRYWPLFEPHHYLKLPLMIGARCYVGTVDGEPVAHLGVGTMHTGLGVEARACRMVVMPEWQGAGVGMRFLNQICEWNLRGDEKGVGGYKETSPLYGKPLTTLFHTSHPGLAAALRRSRGWVQTSANLYGARKSASRKSIRAASKRDVATGKRKVVFGGTGFGGHFRAVQGFRFVGVTSK